MAKREVQESVTLEANLGTQRADTTVGTRIVLYITPFDTQGMISDCLAVSGNGTHIIKQNIKP